LPALHDAITAIASATQSVREGEIEFSGGGNHRHVGSLSLNSFPKKSRLLNKIKTFDFFHTAHAHLIAAFF
jgi:hypothetical protein